MVVVMPSEAQTAWVVTTPPTTLLSIFEQLFCRRAPVAQASPFRSSAVRQTSMAGMAPAGMPSMAVVIFHLPGVGFIAAPADAEAEAGVAAASAAGAVSSAVFEQAPIVRARAAAQPAATEVARVMDDLPEMSRQLGPPRAARQAVLRAALASTPRPVSPPAMPMELVQTWVLPALLGLGLAAAAGLRAFLPLLLLALAAKFQLFGVDLNDKAAWLGSDLAILALGIATAVELAADKVPILDHALSALGTITRPVAAIIAAGSVFAGVDPVIAAVAGLIIGAPTALAFHAAQSGTRVASTATTGGLANPLVSLVEDVLAFATILLALAAPLLVPLALLALAWLIWRLVKAVRRRVSTP